MKIDDDNNDAGDNNAIKRRFSIRSVGAINRRVRLNSCMCMNASGQCTSTAANDADGTLIVANGTSTWED